MFERQTHAYSTDTRAKMVMGQKRAWKRRYKMIEDRNKFYSSWGDCIAESAKKGLLDQQQLEWDSYEKMTSEIAFQQLHSAEKKENAMKMAMLTKMAKKERRTMQRKEKEEEVRSIREAKIKLRLEAKKAKEELQVSRKLKAKITKIRRRKPAKSDDKTESVAIKHQPAIEKLDLEWIQREKSRRDLSLADQIEAAKQKRSVNGGHATITHQVDLDMVVKRLKPKSLLSFADEILAAKKKRAESAMKEALNGEDVATSRLQPSTEKPDFDFMRLKKVQSMSSFADQIQTAKQKQAATKESVINGFQLHTKGGDLEDMRREKVQSMSSFTDQIQAAKQKQAVTKESVINGFQLHTKGEDLEDMRREKVQSMSSFADQIQAAKQKQATTKESVISKGEDLEGMRREKVGGMLSFADQIRAAKQKRAEESAVKEAVAHHQPIS